MSNEPVAAVQNMIDLQYEGPAVDYDKFPLKAINTRLGQTLCEACDYGVCVEDMVFVPIGQDGYGYYHPECVLADKYLLEAFLIQVKS